MTNFDYDKLKELLKYNESTIFVDIIGKLLNHLNLKINEKINEKDKQCNNEKSNIENENIIKFYIELVKLSIPILVKVCIFFFF